MLIGEFSQRSGLSIDTLRYYEKIGLIDPPARDSGGRRDYDQNALNWLDFLSRLNATGMGIKDRLKYAALRREGSDSLSARREMLEQHRNAVAQQIATLIETQSVLDEKIALYQRMERGETVDPQFAHCAAARGGSAR